MAWGGNWYGQLGDGTKISREVPTEINTVTEPLVNSGFETGKAPWRFYTNGSGDFSIVNVSGNNIGRVQIKTAGTNVQLYQAGLVLQANTKYRLSFKAYSNTGHDLQVVLLKQAAPYTNYGLKRPST